MTRIQTIIAAIFVALSFFFSPISAFAQSAGEESVVLLPGQLSERLLSEERIEALTSEVSVIPVSEHEHTLVQIAELTSAYRDGLDQFSSEVRGLGSCIPAIAGFDCTPERLYEGYGPRAEAILHFVLDVQEGRMRLRMGMLLGKKAEDLPIWEDIVELVEQNEQEAERIERTVGSDIRHSELNIRERRALGEILGSVVANLHSERRAFDLVDGQGGAESTEALEAENEVLTARIAELEVELAAARAAQDNDSSVTTTEAQEPSAQEAGGVAMSIAEYQRLIAHQQMLIAGIISFVILAIVALIVAFIFWWKWRRERRAMLIVGMFHILQRYYVDTTSEAQEALRAENATLQENQSRLLRQLWEANRSSATLATLGVDSDDRRGRVAAEAQVVELKAALKAATARAEIAEALAAEQTDQCLLDEKNRLGEQLDQMQQRAVRAEDEVVRLNQVLSSQRTILKAEDFSRELLSVHSGGEHAPPSPVREPLTDPHELDQSFDVSGSHPVVGALTDEPASFAGPVDDTPTDLLLGPAEVDSDPRSDEGPLVPVDVEDEYVDQGAVTTLGEAANSEGVDPNDRTMIDGVTMGGDARASARRPADSVSVKAVQKDDPDGQTSPGVGSGVTQAMPGVAQQGPKTAPHGALNVARSHGGGATRALPRVQDTPIGGVGAVVTDEGTDSPTAQE